MIIIGITGTLGSGKGAVVEYLSRKKGFAHHSARTFLIEEIERRGMPVNRDSMIRVADSLSKEYYPGVISERLYERAMEQGENAVIESLRRVGEVEYFRTHKSFWLIGVDAPPETRYKRAVARGSETDKVTFEEFLEHESRESDSGEDHRGALRKCIDMSDHVLDNSGSLEHLHSQIEDVLAKMGL